MSKVLSERRRLKGFTEVKAGVGELGEPVRHYESTVDFDDFAEAWEDAERLAKVRESAPPSLAPKKTPPYFVCSACEQQRCRC